MLLTVKYQDKLYKGGEDVFTNPLWLILTKDKDLDAFKCHDDCTHPAIIVEEVADDYIKFKYEAGWNWETYILHTNGILILPNNRPAITPFTLSFYGNIIYKEGYNISEEEFYQVIFDRYSEIPNLQAKFIFHTALFSNKVFYNQILPAYACMLSKKEIILMSVNNIVASFSAENFKKLLESYFGEQIYFGVAHTFYETKGEIVWENDSSNSL